MMQLRVRVNAQRLAGGCLFLWTIINASVQACACATVGLIGQPVNTHREEAAIIWDDKTHTERFIRRAQFATQSALVGFIVPTPNKPILTAQSNDLFTRLERVTAPVSKVETIDRLQREQALTAAARSMAIDSRVTEVAWQKVGGYDAAILRATDIASLRKWLKANHFETPPGFDAYISPYIKKKSYFTAFKLHADSGHDGSTQLPAVALTFNATTPYYPYSEPAQSTLTGHFRRELDLYIVASSKVSPTAPGDSQVSFHGGWYNRDPKFYAMHIDWANWIPAAKLGITGTAAAKLSNRPLYLTKIVDYAQDRDDAPDMLFTPAQDNMPVVPPPNVTRRVATTTFIELAITVFLLGALTGCRSMMPLTVMMLSGHGAWNNLWGYRSDTLDLVTVAVLFLAVSELVVDKLPGTMSRKAPPAFAWRILCGAFCGLLIYGWSFVPTSYGLPLGILIGALGAVVGTLSGATFRKRFTIDAKRRDWPVAVIEDIITIVGSIVVIAILH